MAKLHVLPPDVLRAWLEFRLTRKYVATFFGHLAFLDMALELMDACGSNMEKSTALRSDVFDEIVLVDIMLAFVT
jgi:hypothetical protein